MSTNNKIRKKAIHFKQNGSKLSIITLTAEEIINYTKVDHFDNTRSLTDDDQGYQRELAEHRRKKLGNFLDKSVKNKSNFYPMPTAILLSDRECNVEYIDGKEGSFIEFNKGTKFNIIDGQHRKGGLEWAVRTKKNDEIRKYEYAAVLMEGMDKTSEMKQFKTVNGEAKSVNTALVNLILSQMYIRSGDFDDGDEWKIIASLTIKRLNDLSSSPWYQRIVMPNEKAYKEIEIKQNLKLKNHRITNATSFITSLRPVISHLESKRWKSESFTIENKVDDLYTILEVYWSSLEKHNATAFDEARNHVIQKTAGLFAFHKLLVDLMINFSMSGLPIEVQSTYDNKFSGGHYVWIGSSDQWKRNNEPALNAGKAAAYGSMKGYHELYLQILEELSQG